MTIQKMEMKAKEQSSSCSLSVFRIHLHVFKRVHWIPHPCIEHTINQDLDFLATTVFCCNKKK